MIQEYERYLPTAFDENLTLLQKVNKIIQYMNNIGTVTQAMLDQWNQIMEWVMGEGLTDAVNAKLAEWLADGTIADLINADLQTIIDGLQDDVDTLTTNENEFDISKLEPQYISHLNGIRNAVNQSVNVDLETGQLYTTQSDSETNEGFYINRLSPSGEYISSMWIPQGGHGTTIGLDRKTNGNLKIWFYHLGVSKLVQIEYADNVVLNPTDFGVYTDYTPLSLKTLYFTPTFDPYFDYLVLRREDGRVEIRNRMDVRNNIDAVLYYCDIDPAENTGDTTTRPMQGITSYGKDIYWQSGSSSNTMKIQKYDGGTHLKVQDVNFSDLMGEEGIMLFRDNFHEPEGLGFYLHPKTGKKSIIFAISTGGITKRYSILYALNQRGASDHWDSVARVGAPTYQFTKGQRTLSVLDGITKLSDVIKPGHYYIDNTTALTFTDFPYPIGDAGWFVEVSPFNQTMDARQKITRSSSTNKILVMERVFTFDRTNFTHSFGSWTVHNSNSQYGEQITPTEWSSKISNITIAGEYYLSTVDLTAMTDSPDTTVGYRLTVTGGDTEGYVTQKMESNSSTLYKLYIRRVNPSTNDVKPWFIAVNIGS
jgi:hypothetical protein